MKRTHVINGVLTLMVVNFFVSPMNLNGQGEESSSPIGVGFDLVSSYLWRGTKFGVGPAMQPSIEFTRGGFAIGGWGNYNFTSLEGAEADLYVSYSFGFGLSLGVTDYYFPGTEFFDFSDSTGAQAFEVNMGYDYEGFSASANYFMNQAGSAGTQGGDMYFELGYTFKYFGIHVGAGDGWHTTEGNFAICNIGITSTAEIKITDNFSLPIFGAVILNPDKEQFHVVAGITF